MFWVSTSCTSGRANRIRIPLYRGRLRIPDTGSSSVRPDPGHAVHICELRDEVEPGPTGITFITSDIHADYERMRAKGAKFLYPPKLMDWGEWMCEFEDPDGNQFDLKQPIELGPWTP